MSKIQALKFHFIILLSFFLATCADNPENTASSESPKNVQKTLEPFANCKSSDFSKKVFEMGDKEHFVPDSCSFYFDCDCCSSDIYFNANNTFYLHDFCVEEESYTQGEFMILGDTLILKGGGYWTSTIYNEARPEGDSISPEFFYKDTITPVNTTKFLTKKCGANIVLTEIGGSNLIVETSGSYKKCIELMQKGGEIRKLDSMEKNKRPQ